MTEDPLWLDKALDIASEVVANGATVEAMILACALLRLDAENTRAEDERDAALAEREMYFTQRQAANAANELLVRALMEIRDTLTGQNKDAGHVYEIADQALNAVDSRRKMNIALPPCDEKGTK